VKKSRKIKNKEKQNAWCTSAICNKPHG